MISFLFWDDIKKYSARVGAASAEYVAKGHGKKRSNETVIRHKSSSPKEKPGWEQERLKLKLSYSNRKSKQNWCKSSSQSSKGSVWTNKTTWEAPQSSSGEMAMPSYNNFAMNYKRAHLVPEYASLYLSSSKKHGESNSYLVILGILSFSSSLPLFLPIGSDEWMDKTWQQ